MSKLISNCAWAGMGEHRAINNAAPAIQADLRVAGCVENRFILFMSDRDMDFSFTG
jgi:hypothetical protein